MADEQRQAANRAEQEQWFYLRIWTEEMLFNEDPVILGVCPTDPMYLPLSSGECVFFKVQGRSIADRLVRLFNKNHKRKYEEHGTTKLTMEFSFHAASEYDADDLFLMNGQIAAVQKEVNSSRVDRRYPLSNACLFEQAQAWLTQISAQDSNASAADEGGQPLDETSAERDAPATQVAVDDPGALSTAIPESKDTPNRSWTRSDLDNAIHEYKAKRASIYHNLVQAVKRGGEGAKNDARRLFGRNAVARALGVKAKAMVTYSPAWQQIANELGLRGSQKGKLARAQRVGLSIAIEQAAMASEEDEVVRRETVELIKKSMPPEAAEPTIEKLYRREITDDEAREIIDTYADQNKDDRTHKVRQGL